ncbi:MAG: hypothetical protein AB1410_03850 [Acidobacteriota bacterium]
MRIKNIFIFILLASMSFIIVLKKLSTDSSITAQEIIMRMGEKYANFSSYQDTGFIETTFVLNSGKQISRKSFKTYFVRPNLFRFEWRAQLYPESPWILCVLWSDGKDTFTYWESGKFDRMKSLLDGISANAGVSSGGTTTVPCMLIKSGCRFTLIDLQNLSLVGEDKLEGNKCYIIKGIDPKIKKKYKLWIGKKNSLLYKLESRMEFKDFLSITEERHKNIRLEEKIDKEIFNFTPLNDIK